MDKKASLPLATYDVLKMPRVPRGEDIFHPVGLE